MPWLCRPKETAQHRSKPAHTTRSKIAIARGLFEFRIIHCMCVVALLVVAIAGETVDRLRLARSLFLLWLLVLSCGVVDRRSEVSHDLPIQPVVLAHLRDRLALEVEQAHRVVHARVMRVRRRRKRKRMRRSGRWAQGVRGGREGGWRGLECAHQGDVFQRGGDEEGAKGGQSQRLVVRLRCSR